MSQLGVHSEVGQLRQAIVHRPGLELSRLTPSNVDALLFDDILWAEKAREEHDAFVSALQAAGVTTHHFADLFAETLAIPEARDHVLDVLCTPQRVGPALMKPLRDLAEEHPKATAALVRIANGLEGIHAIMKERQAAEAEAEADDLRDRIRDLERLLADNKAAPRRRRAT